MVVAAIFRAASIFRFKKYLKFATQFLEVEFSDRLEDVTPIRSLHAAEAVILGRNWNLPHILKCAFYELARASGFAQASGEVNSSDQDGDDDVESMTRFLHSRAVDVRTDSVGVTSHQLCKWLCALTALLYYDPPGKHRAEQSRTNPRCSRQRTKSASVEF